MVGSGFTLACTTVGEKAYFSLLYIRFVVASPPTRWGKMRQAAGSRRKPSLPSADGERTATPHATGAAGLHGRRGGLPRWACPAREGARRALAVGESCPSSEKT